MQGYVQLSFYLSDTILNAGLVRCKKHKTRKLAKFSDIWTGQYMTFAKEKETGDIYAWGLNNYYQLGEYSVYVLYY